MIWYSAGSRSRMNSSSGIFFWQSCDRLALLGSLCQDDRAGSMSPMGVTLNSRRNFRASLVAWDLRTAWLAAIKYEMVASKSVGSPALRQVWVAVGGHGALAHRKKPKIAHVSRTRTVPTRPERGIDGKSSCATAFVNTLGVCALRAMPAAGGGHYGVCLPANCSVLNCLVDADRG